MAMEQKVRHWPVAVQFSDWPTRRGEGALTAAEQVEKEKLLGLSFSGDLDSAGESRLTNLLDRSIASLRKPVKGGFRW